MFRHLLCAIGLMGAFSTAHADTATLFGAAEETWDAQLSPDGTRIALGCVRNGFRSVCIYGLDSADPPRVFYTGEDARLDDFYWATENHVVGNITRHEDVSTSSGRRTYDLRRAFSYDARSGDFATLMGNVRENFIDTTQVLSLCPADPEHIIMTIGFRVSDSRGSNSLVTLRNQGIRQRTFRVNVATGRAREIDDRDASVLQIILDDSCDPLVNVLYNDELQEYAIELAEGRQTLIEWESVSQNPMWIYGQSSDNQALIANIDYEPYYGLHRISLADGSIEPVEFQGRELGRVGVKRDPFTNDVLGFFGTDHLREETYIDKDLNDVLAAIQPIFPEHAIRITSFDTKRTMFTVVAEAPGTPREYFLFEQAAMSVSPLGGVAPQLAETPLGPITPIEYEARDGMVIPGYLTLPPGKTIEDGPFPTILNPHGGPESRDTAAFDWWSQAYAQAGYAVIQPNFRGSSGYGAAFRNAGFGEFGGKMVNDVIDAIAWAEAEGIADPSGVCSAGASYGGYSSLMTALRAPEKVGCVIAVAPVTDIVTHMSRFDDDTAPHRYWARYAGADPFSDDDFRTDISPVRRTADFRANVLLMHGDEDLVVEYSQSRVFARRWGERRGIEFVTLEGADHYLRTSMVRREILEESLAFLAQHHPAN